MQAHLAFKVYTKCKFCLTPSERTAFLWGERLELYALKFIHI